MNDEALNLSIRKFLKQFGVGAQREIEHAVAAALEAGTLPDNASVQASATLRIDAIGLEWTTTGDITLA